MRVAEIRFEGVRALEVGDLERWIELRDRGWRFWRPHPPLDEAALEFDADRVVALYRRRGYYATAVELRVERSGDETAVVVFVVNEGEPVRVAERRIVWAQGVTPPLGDAELVRDLPGGVGAVFDVRDYVQARDELLRRLGDAGHPAARIEGGAEVDPRRLEARMEWTLHPGPAVRMGSIRVRGLEHTDAQIVRETAALEAGAPLSPSELEASRERLAELRLFRVVVVEARPPEAQPTPEEAEVVWPVEIRVRERPPRTLTLGLGYASEERVRARVEWEHRNLLGRARTLRARARYSSLRGAAGLGVIWPRFLQRALTGELSLDASQERYPSYDARRVQWGLKVGRPLFERWRGHIGYELDWSQTDDVSDATELALGNPDATALLSSIALGLERWTTDSLTDPTRGTRVALRAELSPRMLGSDVSFVGSSAELHGFWPVEVGGPLGTAVLAARLDVATLLAYGASQPEDVPLVRRLFAGGSDSVRGFDFQELGPLDANDEPLGGTSRLVASLEARLPLRGFAHHLPYAVRGPAERFGLVLFVDGGQVDLEPLRFKWSQMRYSTGAGIRVATPVGPLRLDYGYVLNRPDELDRSRLHISVGQAF